MRPSPPCCRCLLCPLRRPSPTTCAEGSSGNHSLRWGFCELWLGLSGCLPPSPWQGTVAQVHSSEGPGDVLAFLTGQEEIESCERLIREQAAALPPDTGRPGLLVLPIYAALPPEQQLRVFQPAPPNMRKVGRVLVRTFLLDDALLPVPQQLLLLLVFPAGPSICSPTHSAGTCVLAGMLQVILATNIAETSITISGVRYVIDTGFVKARSYSPRLGADCLQVSWGRCEGPLGARVRTRSNKRGSRADGLASWCGVVVSYR